MLANGKRYQVPSFQRDYAWTETEWSELWADIEAVVASSQGNHYLGALVLQSASERGDVFEIIDGQQRLVTLTLLALAVISRIERLADRNVEAADNRERARLLRERFVSTKDPASLQQRSRLRLNSTDNDFFQTYLVQSRQPANPRTLQGSEQRLNEASHFFDTAVGKLLTDAATGEQLANFLENDIAARLHFIQIVVQDDETAFTVFETLNARGVALGTADLLKNFVFSVAHRGGAADLKSAHSMWNQILRFVPMEKLGALLFHKLSAQVSDLREKRVFAEVKQLLRTSNVHEFLYDLHASAQLYQALDDPYADFWCDHAPGARKSVRALHTAHALQARPVILAGFQKFADRPQRLERLLRHLLVIHVRATTARLNPGDTQRAYQIVAVKITRGELKSPAAIAHALRHITPTDDEFTSAFSTLAIDPKGSRKRWLRYLFGELEAAASGTMVDLDDGNTSIEHILPENPSADWSAFSSEDRERDTTRLGNLTPLDPVVNRQLGGKAFDDKRALYALSGYALTRAITADEWTPGAVRVRQTALGELAAKVWRIEADDP